MPNMAEFRVKVFLPFFILLFAISRLAFAHGGVSVKDDVCIMKLGVYTSHFTGYQPEKRSTQEFCEDIPELGNVVIVMDFMSDELRAMETDFRILKDVRNVGMSAKYGDLGGEKDIEMATIFHKPSSKYPHGTLSLSHRFEEPGNYIGVVKAISPEGEVFVSVFPFSVGEGRGYFIYVVMLVASCVMTFLLYRFSNR